VFVVRTVQLRERHVQKLFRVRALDVCGFLGTNSIFAENGVFTFVRFPHE
jgi:hypothetical protein